MHLLSKLKHTQKQRYNDTITNLWNHFDDDDDIETKGKRKFEVEIVKKN